jgi:hypothetical protein
VDITRTHNALHLGDNLVHLNFLRRVAKTNPDRTFLHYAPNQYMWQLRPVVADIPNLKLEELSYMLPSDSIESWRGFNNFWHQHPNKNDFVGFHVEWFDMLAKKMKVANPIQEPKDMLFDYPAILEPVKNYPVPFDALVINSAPGSGQFQHYNEYGLLQIARDMASRGKNVVVTKTGPGPIERVRCTTVENLSITEIGHLSLHCPLIVMVSTGPSWPTFNVWNIESVKERVILLDTERLNFGLNIKHCASADEAREILSSDGYL